MDAMAGCGGNIVAFARMGSRRVIAIDIDHRRLAATRHNARLYGVEARVETVHADYLQAADGLEVSVSTCLLVLSVKREKHCL